MAWKLASLFVVAVVVAVAVGGLRKRTLRRDRLELPPRAVNNPPADSAGETYL